MGYAPQQPQVPCYIPPNAAYNAQPNALNSPPIYDPNAPTNNPNIYNNQQQYLPQYQNQQQYLPQYQNQQPQQYAYQPNGTVQPNNNDDNEKEDKKKRWKYDPRNLQIQSMTVDQWSTIQSEQTEYSKYWETPESFEPKNFSENTKDQSKYNDLVWMIIFWINFLIFIAVFAYITYKATKNYKKFLGNYDFVTDPDRIVTSTSAFPSTLADSPTDGDDQTQFTKKVIYYSVGFGVLIGVVINVIHLLYISFAPIVYIKAGFFLLILISVVCCIPLLLLKIWVVLVFPVVLALISLITYCCVKKHIPLSAVILKQSMKIIWKNPSIYIIIFIEMLLEIIISIVFILSLIFTVIAGWSYVIYIYFLFSFYWISMTFGYVIYLTVSGVSAQWYFLNGTEYMPRFGAFSSFKRAITTSFGSAALAGFIMAVIDALQSMARNGAMNSGGCTQVFCCVVLCCLKIIECCFTVIARYALIYCATFGVPFFEGCRRWAELSSKKLVGMLINTIVVSTAIKMNQIMFVFGSAMLGLGLSYALLEKNIWLRIFLSVSAAAFTLCVFSVLKMPIYTLPDTLFVCFSECPENLKTSANELYELIVAAYDNTIKFAITFKDD